MSALSQAPRSMRESCSWEGNTYAKYIFNPHRSWRDGSGSPTGTRIVDKAYAAKRLLDLKDVRYQVLAHFEWNDLREELADDRDENKHHNIAMRSVRQGGRRDIFLGARECQAYVEPCEFGGGEGFYDSYGEWNMGYMFHGFSYPDENPDHNLISRFWMPIMKDGVIRFESPDSPLLDRHIVRHGLNVKEFNLGKNVTSVEEE